MKTLGWIIDDPGYKGGAELDADELLSAAPDWADIVICHPQAVEEDCDAYIVHNCYSFGDKLIPLLEGKPIVKRLYDLWTEGNPGVRRWLLAHADLTLCVSPLQHRALKWHIAGPVEYIPCTVNLAPFRAAQNGHRAGAVWIGRLENGKGLDAALRWATEQAVELDVYGYGSLERFIRAPLRYLGRLAPGMVAGVLAQYERFVFLPDAVEPCSRALVEAWAAGCQLVTNRNCGAVGWIRDDPDALEHSAARFWRAVEKVVKP